MASEIGAIKAQLESEIADVKKLLDRGKFHGVEWRLTKCTWCQDKVVMIGFEVSKDGRKPDPAKVTALKNWPEETELADVNSMFHFANYLREFIPNFRYCPTAQAVPSKRS